MTRAPSRPPLPPSARGLPLRAVLLLALLVLATGTAAAHDHAVARYVVGAGGVAACADTPHPAIDVGGGCRMQVHAGGVRIELVDDVLGAVGFLWEARDAGGALCAGGEGAASVVATLPGGCTRVSVFPALGATTGTVLVSFL